jgi:cobalt-zinc-cadmium resistance protein CzcA
LIRRCASPSIPLAVVADAVLERLIDFAVHQRAATLALSIAFALFGLYTFSKLDLDAFPDVTNGQLMVISRYPGRPAEEVEQEVTIPVERALTGVPGTLLERSITSFGLSQVILTFHDDVDIYFARQQARERLSAGLPDGVIATLGPDDTPVGQIYQYTLESDHHTPSELRGWQDSVVAQQLAHVDGVADVVSSGGFQKEYHVLADPLRLRASGLALRDVVDAVAASNGATSVGYLPHGDSELVVRGRGWLRGRDDIGAVVVRAPGGAPVLVRNLATVVEGYVPRRGAVARAGALDSVEGTILLRRGKNPRDVLEAIHQAVDRINREGLPRGMKIVPFYDRSRLLDATRATVARELLAGAALVTLVLWLFLRAAAGSLAVAVTVPLGLLTAFVGLYYVGVPANLLSLGAIDLGALVGGAAILVENVQRRLADERPPPEEAARTIARAAKEVVRPTLFAMAISAAALVPLCALQRVEGRLFRPIALTWAFALGGALLLTLTCVPALTALLLGRRATETRDPALLVWLRARYLAALRLALRSPIPTRVAALLVLATALALVPRLGTGFLPRMNEGDLHVTVTLPGGVSLDAGARALHDMRRVLLKLPEVKDVLTEQGHPEAGSDDEAPSQAEAFVILKPEREWPGGRSRREVVEAMRVELEKRLGVEYNFSQPIQDRVEESSSGIRGQVVVKIYGDDLDLLQARLDEVRRVLVATRGARDVEVYRAGPAQHIVADIDREATARAGVPARDVEDAIEGTYGGHVATQLWEGGRKVGVRVKLPSPSEGDRFSVARLAVPVDRAWLPLGELARVHVDRERTHITREQGGRFLAVKCNIEGRDLGSFVEEAQARVAREVTLPPGCAFTWSGELASQRRAMRRLEVLAPISVALIFLLLLLAFRALLPALVALLAVPFSMVGGVLALWLSRTELSVSSAVGFVALLGVAMMDAVLLITYIRAAMDEHGWDAEDAIVQAVSQRLRPVLMTALLATVGLLPAALSRSIGSDVQRPFAIVIVGGLISSTLLSLLLLPTWYQLAERWLGSGQKQRVARVGGPA